MDPSAKARQAVFEEWLKWSWERLVIKKWSWQAAPQDRVIRDNHSPSRHTLLSVCLSVWLSSFFKFSPSYLTVVFHACPHWFVTSPLLSLDSVCLITLSRWSNESNWLQITTKSYMHTECSHSVLHPASQKKYPNFLGTWHSAVLKLCSSWAKWPTVGCCSPGGKNAILMWEVIGEWEMYSSQDTGKKKKRTTKSKKLHSLTAQEWCTERAFQGTQPKCRSPKQMDCCIVVVSALR